MKRLFKNSARRFSIIAGLMLAGGSMFGADPIKLQSFVVGTGGGTISNATYSLTSTIGEPAGGAALSGETFNVDSGFASVIVTLELANAPLLLKIASSGGTLKVSWPAAFSTKFVLEASTTLLAPVAWEQVTEVPVEVGDTKTLTISGVPGSKFYRLRQVP